MKQLLTTLSDLLFPPTPEELVLRTVTTQDMLRCYKPQLTTNHTICLAQYNHPLIGAAIRAHKFQHHPYTGKLLATLLDQWLAEQSHNYLMVPVPLSKQRQNERGYNQVLTILQQSNHRSKIVTTLTRHRNTTPQTRLSKTDRLQNVRGAFAINRTIAKIPAGAHVLLVDDVYSTGATMNAARSTLSTQLPANCTLTCLAFAH
jgi:ComF family protein